MTRGGLLFAIQAALLQERAGHAKGERGRRDQQR
jgi:hypothetical protein